jgi:hypothetical protein
VVCITLIVVAVYFFRTAIEHTPADQAGADRAFAETLAASGNQMPLLELRNGEVVLTREIPDVAAAEGVTTLHILAWEPGEASLSRFQLPMWLVRMSDDPIAAQVGGDLTTKTDIPLLPDDIDKFGPALLFDHTETDGARVMVWTR